MWCCCYYSVSLVSQKPQGSLPGSVHLPLPFLRLFTLCKSHCIKCMTEVIPEEPESKLKCNGDDSNCDKDLVNLEPFVLIQALTKIVQPLPQSPRKRHAPTTPLFGSLSDYSMDQEHLVLGLGKLRCCPIEQRRIACWESHDHPQGDYEMLMRKDLQLL